MNITQLIYRINAQVINPAVLVLFLVALVVFSYGIVKFIINMDNETERSTGRQAMLWGLVGMAVMMSVFGIVRLIMYVVGADSTTFF